MAIVHAINTLVGNIADRPAAAAGYKGLIFSALDTGIVSWCDGSNWFNLSVPGSTTTALFNNLDPLTTKGDILTHDGTDSIRRAAPSDNFVLIADSAQTSGWGGVQITTPVTLFAAGLTKTFAPGASYVGVFTTGSSNPTHTRINFLRFREARLHCYGGIQVGSTQVDLKIRDTTNSKDVTSAINFTSTTLALSSTSWGNLDAATYAGDAEIEAQAVETAVGDTGRFDNIILELR